MILSCRHKSTVEIRYECFSSPEREFSMKKPKFNHFLKKKSFECENALLEEKSHTTLTEIEETVDRTFLNIDFNITGDQVCVKHKL